MNDALETDGSENNFTIDCPLCDDNNNVTLNDAVHKCDVCLGTGTIEMTDEGEVV
jgi:hypothetical protein